MTRQSFPRRKQSFQVQNTNGGHGKTIKTLGHSPGFLGGRHYEQISITDKQGEDDDLNTGIRWEKRAGGRVGGVCVGGGGGEKGEGV